MKRVLLIKQLVAQSSLFVNTRALMCKTSVRAFLFVFFVGVFLARPSDTRAQETSASPASEQSIVLRWLGTAGWEIQVGQTVVLIDPFLTRKEPDRVGKEWKTDEEAVLKAIKRADYIFAGHSHADHIGDVPFIAKKFGSKVIGSQTTRNLALTAGVDKSQLVTISGGEKLAYKDFSVQVIDSEHGRLIRGRRRQRSNVEEITKPWSGPILGTSFVEGGTFLYYFTFGKHRLLHQSSGGFIEDNLSGLRPDIALLYPMQRNDLAVMLSALQPKTVFVHHFDEWRTPFSEGIPESNAGRAQRFARDVRAVDKSIHVIVPRFFEFHDAP